jgi:hypothetical protein
VNEASRQTGWCSLQAAQALWEWHVAGEPGEAPDNFTTDDEAATRDPHDVPDRGRAPQY